MATSLDPVRAKGPSGKIAIVGSDADQLAELTKALRRALGEAPLAGPLAAIPRSPGLSLVAVHYDRLSADEKRRLVDEFTDAPECPLLLLSQRCAEQELATLLGSRALTNLLVINKNGVDLSDLLVTIQKIRRGEIFGLEKYLTWGVEPARLRLSRSADIQVALSRIRADVARLGIAPRLRGLIDLVADELLTNAIYDAPVKADGSPRYASYPRVQPVQLDPGEFVEVCYSCDGRRFGISTSDPFGSLSPARLQEYLARGLRLGPDQMREDGGGAGLGFYQILNSLSHFVVNIDPGRRTELIGLVDVSGSYRTFVESGKSFNMFVKRSES